MGIIHAYAYRTSEGMNSGFLVEVLTYAADTKLWRKVNVPMPQKSSFLRAED